MLKQNFTLIITFLLVGCAPKHWDTTQMIKLKTERDNVIYLKGRLDGFAKAAEALDNREKILMHKINRIDTNVTAFLEEIKKSKGIESK